MLSVPGVGLDWRCEVSPPLAPDNQSSQLDLVGIISFSEYLISHRSELNGMDVHPRGYHDRGRCVPGESDKTRLIQYGAITVVEHKDAGNIHRYKVQ